MELFWYSIKQNNQWAEQNAQVQDSVSLRLLFAQSPRYKLMMGAPMHHHRHMGGHGMGFGPGFRPVYRPMRMYHRPMGFFPLGGLFILPALMFGGWIVVAVLGSVLDFQQR